MSLKHPRALHRPPDSGSPLPAVSTASRPIWLPPLLSMGGKVLTPSLVVPFSLNNTPSSTPSRPAGVPRRATASPSKNGAVGSSMLTAKTPPFCDRMKRLNLSKIRFTMTQNTCVSVTTTGLSLVALPKPVSLPKLATVPAPGRATVPVVLPVTLTWLASCDGEESRGATRSLRRGMGGLALG